MFVPDRQCVVCTRQTSCVVCTRQTACCLYQTVVQLTLRQSKTGVFGAGVTICLGRTGDILCPVLAQLAYLVIRPSTPGPLFPQVRDLLSRQTLVATFCLTLSSAGLNVSLINGHSFHIGAATTAEQARIPDSTINLLLRWNSSPFGRYLCPTVLSVAAVYSHHLR